MKKVTQLVLMLCLTLSGAFCHASGVAGQENMKGNEPAVFGRWHLFLYRTLW